MVEQVEDSDGVFMVFTKSMFSDVDVFVRLAMEVMGVEE